MSKVKIVRKRGKLIRKTVKRSMGLWREDILRIIAPHVAWKHPNYDVSAFNDEDFLIWAILVGSNFNYRMDTVTTGVKPLHNARGFEFRLDGSSEILKRWYNALTQLLNKASDRLKRWNYNIDLYHTWDEPLSRITLVLRFYPPLDTITYWFCKKMEETLPHTEHYACGGALGIFIDVGASRIAAEKGACKTKCGDVGESGERNAQVSPAPTLHNPWEIYDRLVEE